MPRLQGICCEMLKRTKQISSLVFELVDRANFEDSSDKALFEAIATNYLAAVLYADVESEVEQILERRFGGSPDEKLGEFTKNVFSNGRGKLKKSDLAQLVKNFGNECKLRLDAQVADRDITNYSNILDCRHHLAHGEPRQETITTAKNGLSGAESILSAIEDAIK